MSLRHRLLVVCFLVALGIPLRGASQAPHIDKIDPPNWWTGMDSPMLLLRGADFAGARFALRSPHGAVIVRQQISSNGHWAFLWLNTARATPGMLHIVVSAHGAQSDAPFVLQQRQRPASGFAGFSPADVLYLIMPDRFADGDLTNDPPASAPGTYNRSLARAYHGGDLRGIEQHLDYLQQLGVTAAWITPVYDNSANHSGTTYHGYSATDMYGVDPHLGTLADLQHLSATLHARGMKLVLDTVPNHVGPHHPWVDDPPAADWLHGSAAQHLVPTGDFTSIVDVHGTERDRARELNGWFADTLPDLNQGSALVRTYLTQNAEWWIESAQLDGLRLDTFPYVQRDFWRDYHAALHRQYPHLTTVGEIFNTDPTIVSYFAGGATHEGVDTSLDTPFDFPIYGALRAVLVHGESMKKLAAVLRQDSLYPHPERLIPFEGNHDTKRFLSEPGATTDELRLAFGLLATLRGTPQIYAGDELAMQGGDDPDNRRDFPGGFPGDPHNAFLATGRTADEAAMHDWVAQLLRVRHQHAALQGGEQQNLLVTDRALAFSRTRAGERILVAVNTADQPAVLTVRLNGTNLAGTHRLVPLLQPETGDATVADDAAVLRLQPRGIAIFTAE